jgi:hypothetical protein
MAGKSNKLKIKKLQINFTNRWLYTLIVFFSLVVIGVFVYAQIPNPGHDITQIIQPSGCSANQVLKWTGSSWTCDAVIAQPSGCSANQFLKWTGSSWTCAGVEAGTETDPVWTAASTNVAFINKANTFDGAITATTLTAATINTGNGAKEVNSIAAYLGNQNLRTTDSPTFGGATINGIFTLDGPTTLTINANNAITVTRSYHRLNTYYDRSTDFLETIKGGEVGMILVLQTRLATRDVTLKDNDGNLYLDGDFTLGAPTDKIVLIRISTSSWSELSRSDN